MYKPVLPVLCLLLIISVTSYAQEKKIEIDFKSPKSAMSMYNSYSIVNKERNRVCILAVGHMVIRGYILNQDYVLLKEFEGEKAAIKQVLVGGYFEGDKVHYLLARSESEDEITHYTYDPVSGTNRVSKIDLEIKKSMFMGGLSLGDQFLFVTVKKKEDRIMVYRFGKKDQHEVLQFDYPASAMARESLLAAFSKGDALYRNSEISYISDWELPAAGKVKDYCDIYYRNDSLLITVDREKNKIYVLSLDLAAQKISGRHIPRDFNYCEYEFQSSSFLLDERLYSVVCCRDMLQLSVYDFYTGKMIKEYRTERDEEISFRSTDIIQEGGGYFSGGDRKIEKTKQLLRKMTNGRALIIGRNASNGIVELTIGSYRYGRNYQPGAGAGPAGTAGAGATFSFGFGPGFSYEWTETARFKTLLDKTRFEKIDGEIEKPLEEKIEAFTKEIKIPAGCEGIYPVGKKLAYYYFDRKQGKLVVTSL